MELTGKFWCGNCGKPGSIKDIVECTCKKKPAGEKWIDKQEHYVFKREGIELATPLKKTKPKKTKSKVKKTSKKK